MPMSVALSCQSKDMTVQRVQQQQQRVAALKEEPQVDSKSEPQKDAAMSAPIRTVQRFTNTTVPTIPAPLNPQSTE